MGKQFSLTAETKVVQALAPAADAAGRTGPFFSIKGCHKAAVIASLTQGNAAPVPVSLVQAKDLAGTGAKPVAHAYIRANEDCTASDTLVEQPAGPGYSTGAGTTPKQVVFEVVPEFALDLAGGYSCLAVVTGASNAANVTAATAVLGPLRYAQDTPSAAAF